MKKFIALTLITFLLSGCLSKDDNGNNENNYESELIGKGNLYGNGVEGIDPQNLIISNTTEWNELLKKINTSDIISNNFTNTDIDFERFRVIAAFDEIHTNGGHELLLDITKENDIITVYVSDKSPDGDATSVITQPYHIVAIKDRNTPVIFEGLNTD